MAGATVDLKLDLSKVESALKQSGAAMSKLDALGMAAKDAVEPTAKMAASLVSQPGMAGYTPRHGERATKRPIRDQMRATFRVYTRTKRVVGVAGPQYKKIGGGNHGHLIEFGHRIANGGTLVRIGKWASKSAPKASDGRIGAGIVSGSVVGNPFLEPAAAATKKSAQVRFETEAGQFIDKALEPMKNG